MKITEVAVSKVIGKRREIEFDTEAHYKRLLNTPSSRALVFRKVGGKAAIRLAKRLQVYCWNKGLRIKYRTEKSLDSFAVWVVGTVEETKKAEG